MLSTKTGELLPISVDGADGIDDIKWYFPEMNSMLRNFREPDLTDLCNTKDYDQSQLYDAATNQPTEAGKKWLNSTRAF